MKLYKIRDTKTGLYSRGGSSCKVSGDKRHWSKLGRVWTTLGFLKSHLAMYKKVPSTWEVVELEIDEVRRFPVAELVKE